MFDPAEYEPEGLVGDDVPAILDEAFDDEGYDLQPRMGAYDYE